MIDFKRSEKYRIGNYIEKNRVKGSNFRYIKMSKRKLFSFLALKEQNNDIRRVYDVLADYYISKWNEYRNKGCEEIAVDTDVIRLHLGYMPKEERIPKISGMQMKVLLSIFTSDIFEDIPPHIFNEDVEIYVDDDMI